MKRKGKISTKMLAVILPVIIVAMTVLTAISVVSSRSIIEAQIRAHMDSELKAQMNGISEELNVVGKTAMDLSRTVGNTYKTLQLPEYEALLKSLVADNPLILGCGIWFEPYAYDSAQQYVGPYVYKDGSNYVVTYDYSNAEYDYPNQAYYTNVANGETTFVYTDPYYDPTLDVVMASCSMPIYDESNTFIGVVTTDIELTSIQNMVSSIKVGEKGSAILTTGGGSYISCPDNTKVADQLNITEEKNQSLAAAASTVLANPTGITTYSDGSEEYNLYYSTIEGLGWKLMIQMPQSELNEPIIGMMYKLLLICFIALLLTSLAVLFEVTTISRKLKKVQNFAGFLAQGDFTIEPLEVKTTDELGQMGDSLNEMYQKNKNVIQNISEQADTISHSSNRLERASSDLLDQFTQIENYMSKVNEAMMSSSAATEEVNASAEEVLSSVGILTNETDRSLKLADEIRGRAGGIEQTSQEAFQYATNLSVQYEENLTKSIENAKVVESISTMANVISTIAEQINLLSLNASIEAARAGEQGRGFAVVASEIGKLAGETSKAVDEIQKTILAVQSAFDQLTVDSKSLLGFLTGTVTPDYDRFVGVSKQYGTDAASIETYSKKISNMSEAIERIMGEAGIAIQNIAESAQETADHSSNTMQSVNQVSGVVEQVTTMSKEQQAIATDLSDMVGNFKLRK